MDKILNHLSNKDFFKKINDRFELNDEVHLTNTNDSISVFTVLNLFNTVNHSILIVTPNIFKAQKVYEQLSNILDQNNIGFFPQDEFLTTEMLAMSNEFKLERINTIKKIIGKNKLVVITNTTGLIKHLQPKKTWEKAIIRLKKGDVVDFNLLINKLN